MSSTRAWSLVFKFLKGYVAHQCGRVKLPGHLQQMYISEGVPGRQVLGRRAPSPQSCWSISACACTIMRAFIHEKAWRRVQWRGGRTSPRTCATSMGWT